MIFVNELKMNNIDIGHINCKNRFVEIAINMILVISINIIERNIL